MRLEACPRCQRRLTQLLTGPYCFACGYGSFGLQLAEQPKDDEPSWPLWLLAFFFVVWCGVFVFAFLVSNGAFVR